MNQDNNNPETQRKQKMLRLSEAANKALRASTSHHGDVSKAINHAILGTDLATVKVFPRTRAPFLGNKPVFNTSAVFEPGVYEMVQEAAEKRGISTTVLIDGVIIHFYGGKQEEEQEKPKNVPRKKGDRKMRNLRLSEAANKALRAYTSRDGDVHGNVSAAVNRAILGTDLAHVKVFPRSRVPYSGTQEFFNTSAIFEPGVYEMVQEAAARRNVSAIVLIDGVIIDFYRPRAAKGAKNVESDSSNHHQPEGRGR